MSTPEALSQLTTAVQSASSEQLTGPLAKIGDFNIASPDISYDFGGETPLHCLIRLGLTDLASGYTHKFLQCLPTKFNETILH